VYLWLVGKIFYECLLNPLDLQGHLILKSVYFLSGWPIQWWEWGDKVTWYYCLGPVLCFHVQSYLFYETGCEHSVHVCLQLFLLLMILLHYEVTCLARRVWLILPWYLLC
jgi:hypothetical protein